MELTGTQIMPYWKSRGPLGPDFQFGRPGPRSTKSQTTTPDPRGPGAAVVLIFVFVFVHLMHLLGSKEWLPCLWTVTPGQGQSVPYSPTSPLHVIFRFIIIILVVTHPSSYHLHCHLWQTILGRPTPSSSLCFYCRSNIFFFLILSVFIIKYAKSDEVESAEEDIGKVGNLGVRSYERSLIHHVTPQHHHSHHQHCHHHYHHLAHVTSPGEKISPHSSIQEFARSV